MANLRIAIAQINTTVGGLSGNTSKIIEYIKKSVSDKVDIVCFPELAISGYPPEDLLLKPDFIKNNANMLKSVVNNTENICVILGALNKSGKNLYNSAVIICNKKIYGIYNKSKLPNYGVFDENRYFVPGDISKKVFKYKNLTFGVAICEDIWHKDTPVSLQVKNGAKMIFVINASPYFMGKLDVREKTVVSISKKYRIPVVYNNLTGGQDELIFDGQSIIVDNGGKIVHRCKGFDEDYVFFDYFNNKFLLNLKNTEKISIINEVYDALKLGLKDYVQKNGFRKVIIGLSGGIDSSLVAAISADALGKDNVTGVLMPSMYSSVESTEDALKLAANLGIKTHAVSISETYKRYLSELSGIFDNSPAGLAEENLQARIRGNILMALSNKFGYLVLTTGNKSEVSTGYCTLYGDMAGGFSVIKDVPKTLVYELAEYKNRISGKEIIPDRVFKKAPTAELKPNQKDSDSLPEYGLLDKILKLYIQEDMGFSEIARRGYDKSTVQKVINLVDKSEYKRRQSAPGIKITPKSFGKDRRMPVTNRYTYY